jgi:hypothetical protein
MYEEEEVSLMVFVVGGVTLDVGGPDPVVLVVVPVPEVPPYTHSVPLLATSQNLVATMVLLVCDYIRSGLLYGSIKADTHRNDDLEKLVVYYLTHQRWIQMPLILS